MAVSGHFQRDSLDQLLSDLNSLSLYESTPLHYAVLGGNEETVRYLVGKGAHMNARNIFQESSLHWACKVGDPSVVRFLLRHNATVTLDSESNTPMHWAAEYDHAEVIFELLQNGDGSSGVKNGYGQTPPQIAEENKSKRALEAIRKGKVFPRALSLESE